MKKKNKMDVTTFEIRYFKWFGKILQGKCFFRIIILIRWLSSKFLPLPTLLENHQSRIRMPVQLSWLEQSRCNRKTRARIPAQSKTSFFPQKDFKFFENNFNNNFSNNTIRIATFVMLIASFTIEILAFTYQENKSNNKSCYTIRRT